MRKYGAICKTFGLTTVCPLGLVLTTNCVIMRLRGVSQPRAMGVGKSNRHQETERREGRETEKAREKRRKRERM